jgi:hypothetical protein
MPLVTITTQARSLSPERNFVDGKRAIRGLRLVGKEQRRCFSDWFPRDDLGSRRLDYSDRSRSGRVGKAAVRCIFHVYGFSVICSRFSHLDRRSGTKSALSRIKYVLHRALSRKESMLERCSVAGLGVVTEHGGVTSLDRNVKSRLRAS